MEKNTKILLSVAGLALLGYYLWLHSSKNTAPAVTTAKFVGADGVSGQPCSFKMDGEIVSGKISELDNKYCFSTDGKRGLAI
jgi:hypothetical protein